MMNGTRRSEDSHVCFDLLRNWNFGFVHQVLTYSRRDNVSIVSHIRSVYLELFADWQKSLRMEATIFEREILPAI